MDKELRPKNALLLAVTERLTKLFRRSEKDPATDDSSPGATSVKRKARTKRPQKAVQLPPLPTSYSTPTPLRDLAPSQVPKALQDYVNEHIADQALDVMKMVRDLKTNRTTLFALMHEAFQTTPSAYITDCRMEYACQLLKIGIKASTVAERCGYTDPKYFGKVFKRRFGVLPSQYNLQTDTE